MGSKLGHGSSFGGFGGGHGQSHGGFGQSSGYGKPPKKQGGGMGGAGMLAAGNYSVFHSMHQWVLTRFPHLQVRVLVCWEVCSSPMLSTTSVMISVVVVTLATLATSNPSGIYV